MSETKLAPRERNYVIGNALAYITTVALNGISTAGLLTGKTIGEISDNYDTKFTPAGGAFSIWGLIYAGLALFILMQLVPSCGAIGMRSDASKKTLFEGIGPWFMVSCACNSLWIILFSFDSPTTNCLSSLLLFGLLGSLLVINDKCELWQVPRNSPFETIALDFTFSVYSGWATVASIANVCLALVSLGWQGAPWSAEGWSCLMIAVAAIVFVLYIVRRKNGVYGLVYPWAVAWIAVANARDPYIFPTAVAFASLVGLVALGMIVWRSVEQAEARKAGPEVAPGVECQA